MTESLEVIKTLLFPYATTACSWYINWIQKKAERAALYYYKPDPCSNSQTTHQLGEEARRERTGSTKEGVGGRPEAQRLG